MSEIRTIGVIGGGTSVNSIAFEAWFDIDMRSPDAKSLDTTKEKIMAAIKEAVVGHLGVAVISRHALRDTPAHELCVLPVAGMPIRSQWHVVHPRAKQLSPIAQVFRQQQQIDALIHELRTLRDRIPEGGGGADVRNLRDEIPPHY